MTPNPAPEIDREVLQRALELRRPLARAGRLASGEGAMLLVFGALTLIVALASRDLLGGALGLVLVGVGGFERRFAPRLAEGDPDAPRALAGAELALLAGIVLYSLSKLLGARASGSELAAELEGMGDLGIDVAGLTESIAVVIYATLIAVTLLYQGGMARYFLRRARDVEAYRAGAPEWARKMARELA